MSAYDVNKDRYPSATLASQPARFAKAIVPSDTFDVTDPSGTNMISYAKALYIGISGDLTVITAGDTVGTQVTFSAYPQGWLPVSVRRVLATGTTAQNIVGVHD